MTTDLGFRRSTPTTTTTRRPTRSPATSSRRFRKRAMQWAEIDGKQRLVVAGKVNRFIPNPQFDPVARPGALDEYFRGKPARRRHPRRVRRARADQPRVPATPTPASR